MFCDDTRLLSKSNSEEDVEFMQADLDKAFQWADNNNMKFSSEKFELLSYGKNEAIKENTVYFSGDENNIEEKEVLRDLGVQMNHQANLEDHISEVCQKAIWLDPQNIQYKASFCDESSLEAISSTPY